MNRLQSLINALPAPPGRTTAKEIAVKLRNHPAWRNDFDGSKMELSSVISNVNLMVRTFRGEIMSTIEPARKLGQQSKRFIWRGARKPT